MAVDESIHAGARAGRPRGKWWRAAERPSASGPAFRDPPLRAEIAAKKRELARTLVGAAELPVELPRFRLRLVDLDVEDGAVSLVIGSPDPMAALTIRARSPGDLVALRAPSAQPPAPVVVTIDLLREERVARFRSALHAMQERLSFAMTEGRWAAAQPLIAEIDRLADIPLDQLRQLIPGTHPPEALVRTGFACNQACGVCWQGRDWGGYGASQILTWIEDLRAAGAETLSISGGEPTLDAELADYVRHARAVGFRAVMIQTNAIQFAKDGYAERMLAAGLDEAFVSLHSGDAATSDAITRAPGTHARTVRGIARLLDVGITVNLNCVMTPESLTTLDSLPDFVHSSFGAHPKLRGLVLTVPMAPFDRALAPSILPDPVELRRVLPRALERAWALGVRIHNLEGPCGPQLCAFGADARFATVAPVPSPVSFRKHVAACDGCAVKSACFGVRTEQLERYGDACVEPIVARARGLAPTPGA